MKILITSDIHINDFKSYNINDDNRFRLNQYQTLADRLTDIIKEETVEAVFIAGDFLHIPSPRPFVVNAAGKFLRKISDKVPVYITIGQHDSDSKTLMSEENTLLSLYDNINNVNYLHKKELEIGGIRVWFQGWTPDQDFSNVPKNTYDLLIGHVTVNGATMNNFGATATGTDFDNTKFKLCIVGDIHFAGVKQNIIIPGVPIQTNFGDGAETSVIILDTDDLSWKRVSTDAGKQKFLKFLVTDKFYKNDPYFITKLPANHKNATKQQEIAKSLDVWEVIEKYVNSENLTDIHSKALKITNKEEAEGININFTLDKVKILNFRSINNFTWQPQSGVSLIMGKVGSGKSSLLEAVRFGILGNAVAKDVMTLNKEEMSVEVNLTYNSFKYKIIRGYAKKASYLKFFKNDKEQEFDKQATGNTYIAEELPFLKLYSILHRDQDTPRLLASHNYSERIEWLLKVLGLSAVDNLRIAGEILKDPVQKNLDSLNFNVSVIASYLESMKNTNLDEESVSYTEKIKSTTKNMMLLTSLPALDKQYETCYSELEKLKFSLDQYSDQNFTNFSKIDVKEEQINLNNINENIKNLVSQTNATDEKINKLKIKLSNKKSDLANLTKTIQDLNSKQQKISLKTCYTCEQIIDKDITDKLIYNITLEKTTNNEKFKTLTSDMPEILSEIKVLEIEKLELNKKIQEFVNLKPDLISKISNAENLNNNYDKYSRLSTAKKMADEQFEKIRFNLEQKRKEVSDQLNVKITSKIEAENLLNEEKSNLVLFKERMANQERLSQIKTEVKLKKETYENLTKDVLKIKNEIKQYDNYIQLMSDNGIVLRTILTSLSEKLSNEFIKVEAHKTLKNGKVKPDFNAFLKVANNWISYDMPLSGGQKLKCDLFILKNLIDIAGGAGLLVFDETFASFDSEHLEFSVDILKQMSVDKIFIISHDSNFPVYDNLITTEFDDKTGKTTYQLT